MLENYKTVLEEIEVPQELVQATARKMMQAQLQSQAQTQPRYRHQSRPAVRFMRIAAPAAACLAVVLLSFMMLRTLFAEQDFILTPMEDGIHIEQVELTDGSLVFLSENKRLVNLPQFARPDVQTQGYSEEFFELDNGGLLSVVKLEGRLPPSADPARAKDSVINGNHLAVGVYDGFGIYWAQFMLDGVGHYVQGENLTQEDFIRLLHELFEW